MRSKTSRAADSSSLPRYKARFKDASRRFYSLSNERSSTSRTVTSKPATATDSAIPDPISPPPSTATRWMFIIPPLPNTDSPTLLLSVDFEDWHQLARRRVGWRDWERPGPALARQTD